MNRLRQMRIDRGLTQEQLAKALATTQSQIGKLEAGKRRITLDWAVKLATALNVKPSEIMDGDHVPMAMVDIASPPTASTVTPPRQPSPIPVNGNDHSIPVYTLVTDWSADAPRIAEGSIGQAAVLDVLRGVPGAYGLRVVEDVMRPRYRPPQMLYVHPLMPPSEGAGVVVRLKDGGVLVREWVQADRASITLREYYPEPGVIQIPRGDIEAVHVVVGLME